LYWRPNPTKIKRMRLFLGCLAAFLAPFRFLLYDLLEWGTANLVASDLGTAYLGSQGGVRDAH
jgi:uncharacterized membrane protein YjdF